MFYSIHLYHLVIETKAEVNDNFPNQKLNMNRFIRFHQIWKVKPNSMWNSQLFMKEFCHVNRLGLRKKHHFYTLSVQVCAKLFLDICEAHWICLRLRPFDY